MLCVRHMAFSTAKSSEASWAQPTSGLSGGGTVRRRPYAPAVDAIELLLSISAPALLLSFISRDRRLLFTRVRSPHAQS